MATAGALVSVVGILGLAASDPKRLRGKGRVPPPRVRTAFAFLVLAPGVWLAATAQGVAFLIWIGASAVLGWAIAALAGRTQAALRK